MSNPELYLNLPFKTTFDVNFNKGNTLIVITADVPENSSNFNVKLEGSNENGIGLFFEPSQEAGVVVRKSLKDGVWSEEQKSGSCPVKPGQPLQLMILIEKNQYEVAINGDIFVKFPHKLAPEQLKYILIDGDINVVGVNFYHEAIDDDASNDFTPGTQAYKHEGRSEVEENITATTAQKVKADYSGDYYGNQSTSKAIYPNIPPMTQNQNTSPYPNIGFNLPNFPTNSNNNNNYSQPGSNGNHTDNFSYISPNNGGNDQNTNNFRNNNYDNGTNQSNPNSNLSAMYGTGSGFSGPNNNYNTGNNFANYQTDDYNNNNNHTFNNNKNSPAFDLNSLAGFVKNEKIAGAIRKVGKYIDKAQQGKSPSKNFNNNNNTYNNNNDFRGNNQSKRPSTGNKIYDQYHADYYGDSSGTGGAAGGAGGNTNWQDPLAGGTKKQQPYSVQTPDDDEYQGNSGFGANAGGGAGGGYNAGGFGGMGGGSDAQNMNPQFPGRSSKFNFASGNGMLGAAATMLGTYAIRQLLNNKSGAGGMGGGGGGGMGSLGGSGGMNLANLIMGAVGSASGAKMGYDMTNKVPGMSNLNNAGIPTGMIGSFIGSILGNKFVHQGLGR